MVSVDSTVIDVVDTDDYVEVVLNRPNKRNAFNLELADDLHSILTELCSTGEKGILFRGEGPVTTAGADVSVVGGEDDAKKRQLTETINDIYQLLHEYPRPTVMPVKGAAVGAGFQFVMAVDFAIVAEGTTLLKPEIEYGVFSEYSTRMIAHQAGSHVAREIALAGTTVPPEQALHWGLISDVVPEDEVESAATDLLSKLVEFDPIAYRKTKEALVFDARPEEFETYP